MINVYFRKLILISISDSSSFLIQYLNLQPFIYLLTFRSKFKCSENDDAEDVLGALEETMNLNWTSGNRILFHLTDSPHHGKYLEFVIRNQNSINSTCSIYEYILMHQ